MTCEQCGQRIVHIENHIVYTHNADKKKETGA
jgi:hypothetical protein